MGPRSKMNVVLIMREDSLHCKYIGSTQYSFWQCYISHSNLAVVSTADDCVQPTTVSKSSIQSKKLAFPKFCQYLLILLAIQATINGCIFSRFRQQNLRAQIAKCCGVRTHALLSFPFHLRLRPLSHTVILSFFN